MPVGFEVFELSAGDWVGPAIAVGLEVLAP